LAARFFWQKEGINDYKRRENMKGENYVFILHSLSWVRFFDADPNSKTKTKTNFFFLAGI